MRAEVVVTGLGAIGPWGLGRAKLSEVLESGRPMAVEIDRSAGYHAEDGSRRAALVPTLDLAPWLPPAQARRMAMPSRWSAAATRMALDEAGLPSLEGRSTCVVMATTFGSVLFSERLVAQILREGPEAAQPFYFSECVANAPAAQIALGFGARGANLTITQREAGPLIAVAHAAADVGEGRCDVAIVGAVDEMTPLLHALLDRYAALARASGEGDEAPRPFDRRRDGILAGEGATVLVVERETDARSRGARPLARLFATGSAFDPTATESDRGTGHVAIAGALRASLNRADVPLDSIAGWVSGGSGARRGDELEGRIVRELFRGRALPPVLAPKGAVGEYGGGMLASAMLAVGGTSFGRLAGFQDPDPGMMIVPHVGALPPGRVLVTATASGGAAAWLVLDRP